MTIKQLECFCLLAKKQHYARTAEELDLPQSSLSRMIRQLEQELGVPLFQRVGRGVELSPYGEYYLTFAIRALEDLESGARGLLSMTDQRQEQIAIACIYYLGPEFLPKLMRRFNQQGGNASFMLQQKNTLDVMRLVKEGEVDLGFCAMVGEESSLEFVEVHRSQLVLIVPDNHPLARYDEVPLSRAAQYSFVLPLDYTGIIETIFQDAQLPLPTVACRANEDQLIAGLVSEGMGIAIVPENRTFDRYDIKVVRISGMKTIRSSYLVRRKNIPLSPAAERFYQFCIQNRRLK